MQYILEKAREKHGYNNTFTEHNIKTLFCNIEQILEFHKSLVVELSTCLGPKGPAYDTPIAQCYIKHVCIMYVCVCVGIVGVWQGRREGGPVLLLMNLG